MRVSLTPPGGRLQALEAAYTRNNVVFFAIACALEVLFLPALRMMVDARTAPVADTGLAVGAASMSVHD
jgi:hypothetical protein